LCVVAFYPETLKGSHDIKKSANGLLPFGGLFAEPCVG